MKSTISILLTSVALTIGGYLGWREWQPNLTGHWDIVEEPLDKHYSTLAWMETLDITNDNTVYLIPRILHTRPLEQSTAFSEVCTSGQVA